jgi:hypothetical protein
MKKIEKQDFVIFIGENIQENREIRERAAPTDIWMFCPDCPGNHIVVESQYHLNGVQLKDVAREFQKIFPQALKFTWAKVSNVFGNSGTNDVEIMGQSFILKL